jgi:hypothetical protein
MPENNSRPLPHALIEVHHLLGHHVLAGTEPLETKRLAPPGSERGHEVPLAGSDVEHRTSRRDFIEPRRQAGS